MRDTFQDDGKRGNRALEISVRIEANHMGVVIFDDVRRDQTAAGAERHFVTAVPLPLEAIRELSVSDEQLTELGRMVMAELRVHVEASRSQV